MNSTTPKGKPGRPKVEGLAERRREEILVIATEIFARQGLRGTDVQEIADRCEIGKGTVYRYFPSKDELFLATVHRVNARMIDALREVIRQELDPIERLERLIERFLLFFEENSDFVEVLIQERAEFRERGRLTFFDYRDALHEELGSYHDELAATGRLRHPQKLPKDSAVSELLYGTILTLHLTGQDVSSDEKRRQIIDALLNGILK
jgi:AcrR family transcriptional regulator